MSEGVRKLGKLQRIPVIIKGVVEGKSYGEIAEECGVSERTIYRDRGEIPFKDFFNTLADGYMKDLTQLEQGGNREKTIAFSHKGMLLRAMLKAVIPTKIEAEITGPTDLRLSLHPSLISAIKEELE